MRLPNYLAFSVILAALPISCLAQLPASSPAQQPTALCHPTITDQIVVASAQQRLRAGNRAQPPVTDVNNGFAWPDTPLGVIKTPQGYEFFGSDGGYHARQEWHGHTVGTNKAGSVVMTLGTLDNPLGSEDPQDVSISANPHPAVNPNYPSYGYMGGGPVYQIPQGLPHAGSLLVTYHAELPSDALYAALGLASSTDNGRHWTDLGEIIRFNQSFSLGLDGFEIGDGPLVLSPDGKYFYLYFPDWSPNGTLHTSDANGTSTTTNVSVARAPVAAVLQAAFDSVNPTPGDQPFEPELQIQRHTVPFEKFYKGSWHLQPGIGGASTDLIPQSPYQGYIDIHFNSSIHRYVMLISNDTQFGYAESVDALTWTHPTLLGNFNTIAAYPTAVGLGDDPHVLGKSFYVYYTHLPTDGTGWTNGQLRRMTLTCP